MVRKLSVIISLMFVFCFSLACNNGKGEEMKEFTLHSIVNFTVGSNSCMLTDAAHSKLVYSRSDVKKYLRYTYDGEIKSAVFDEENGNVSITLDDDRKYDYAVEIIKYPHADATAEATLKSAESKAIAAKEHGAVMIGDSLFANWSSLGNPDIDLSPDMPLYNFGIGGFTVADLKDKVVPRLVLPTTPDKIIMHIGVNDIFQAGYSVENYLDSVKKLTDELIKYLPWIKVYFVSIVRPTDIAPTVTGITGAGADARRNAIDAANAAMKQWCEETGKAEYIDAQSSYSDAAGRSKPQNFYPDGIHLVKEAYPAWGELIGTAVFGE